MLSLNSHAIKLFIPIHLLAFLGLFLYSWTSNSVCLVFFGWFLFGQIGVNIGLHRYLSHRQFELHPWLHRLIVFVGLFSGGGSPIFWACAHRHHHAHSDTSMDLHSPKHGFLWSYFGWMLTKYNTEKFGLQLSIGRDLLKDRFIVFTHKNYYRIVWSVIFAVGLVNPEAAFFFVILPMALIINQESLINYFGHHPRLGYQNFTTNDSSKNFLVWGWLSLGAAYQNNHHQNPSSPKFSSRQFEFDLGFYLIQTLVFVSHLLPRTLNRKLIHHG